jgi:type IV secretion system protein VirB11
MQQTNATVEDRAKAKLERDLGPEFLAAFNHPRTLELILNPDGQVFLERLGEPMVQIGTMTPERAQAMLETIAGINERVVTKAQPLLECEWPLSHARFAGQLPPVVRHAAFILRKHPIEIFTLDDYVQKGEMSQRHREAIAAAIRARKNIFVSGGTGSGKTTLVNAMLKEMAAIFPGARILVIEDTGEIQCRAVNYTQWHTTVDVTLRMLIRHALRARPDRIIVGEVRGAEALDLLILLNTGHEGGIATIHANNAKACLSRLEMAVGMHPESPKRIEQVIAEAVGLIVHIAKTPEGRRVQEVLEVTGYRDSDYLTRPL